MSSVAPCSVRGSQQIDQQAGIIELTVEVNDAAAQTFGLDRGKALQRLLARKNPRCAEAILAGEKVVELQSDAIKGRLPPIVIGHDESQIADQVRGVLQAAGRAP